MVVGLNNFNIPIDASERYLQGIKEGAQIGALERQRDIGRLAAQAQGLQGVTQAEPGKPTQSELIQQARNIDPVMAEEVLGRLGLSDAGRREEAARVAAQALTLPYDQQTELLQNRVQALQAQGRDPSDTAELLDMTPEQRNEMLATVQMLDLSTKERLAFSPPTTAADKEKSTVKQLEMDLKRFDKKFDQSAKLRGEIDKVSTEFKKSQSAFGRVEASAEDPSPAGDLALIFNFMKVLDPGSTVREGEFANAQNSGGVSSKVRGLYNQIINGKRLTNEQRDDFVKRSGKLFGRQKAQNKKDVDRVLRVGKRFGLSKQDILGVNDQAQAQPQAGQQVQPTAASAQQRLESMTQQDLENMSYEELVQLRRDVAGG